MTDSAPAAQSFARRDLLRQIEQRVQQQWEANKAFEAIAKDAKHRKPSDKYLASFPYPYMNGVIHLGHAFTLLKTDFQCHYQRLRGKNVLWAFGWHCTGMPIQASAQKLERELREFGNPPNFSKAGDDAADEEMTDVTQQLQHKAHIHSKTADGMTTVESTHAAPIHHDHTTDANKHKPAINGTAQPAAAGGAARKGGKSKVAAKATGETTQYGNMLKMGVSPDDIPKFADPVHWLHYFPPIGRQHLADLGIGVDWRRSFITTDANQYYDSFIRWQFRRLKKLDKVRFGYRPCIFSPIDNQACTDHDRAEGEGVQITDYTLIKMKLQQPYPQALQQILDQNSNYKSTPIYLPAATLRPETMYGQTNAWLLPDGEYGVFVINAHKDKLPEHNEIFITSAKSALNMSYQDLTPVRGKPEQLGTVKGMSLLGSAISSPYAHYEKLYLLPLLTISMNKGTGVVTSVTSDAPDDYAAWKDLKMKPALREKFNITEEMVTPFPAVPIVHTPGLGDTPAVTLCEEAKVASQNDKQKLTDIKDKCYTLGFAKGVMLVGKHKGEKVSVAKGLIKDEMIAEGVAYAYSEPESRVVSRSGNDCVVALTDQWYTIYGEPEWQSYVLKHVQNTLQTYNPRSKHEFEVVLSWMHEWACSRSFGLGTKLPFDDRFVIESLSDSTIYMAYYTVAHYLQQDIYGKTPGLAEIQPQDLNDDCWDYIMTITDTVPTNTNIAPQKLEAMRNELAYWYPLDLRVSGKDLINNHLTMSLYNHAAIWPDRPEMMPQAFFTNGHVMVDSEKMSKSKGNFITLTQAIQEYSADATRLACADAGDSMEDANFERKAANAAILRLTKEETWIREILADITLRTGELEFFDRVFMNEITIATQQVDQAYSTFQYRDALKFGYFELQDSRDRYRVAIHPRPLHRAVVERYIEVSTLLLSPICPHYAQHIWEYAQLDKKHGTKFIAHARWPTATEGVDALLTRQSLYLRKLTALVREMHQATIDFTKKRIAKNKPTAEQIAADPLLNPPNSLIIFAASQYTPQAQSIIGVVQKLVEPVQLQHSDNHTAVIDALDKKALTTELKKAFSDKKQFQDAMKFSGQITEEYKLVGPQALELQLPFDETKFIQEYQEYIVRELGLKSVRVMTTDELQSNSEVNSISLATQTGGKATPGKPSPFYYYDAKI